MSNSSVQGRIWFFVVAVAFVCLMVTGGTSAPSPWVRLGLSLGSLGIIVGAAWILRRGLPGRLASTAIAIVCLTILLFALQLVPLPASWQSLLAGREPFIAANKIAGVDANTLAISLSPAMTISAMLALLPGVAMFAAGLSLEPRYRIGIAALFTVFAILSALLGVAQRFAGSEALYLYDYTGIGIGSGLFGNRNFFAALLYVSIPMLAVLAFTAVKNQLVPGWLVTLLGLAYLTVIVGGLAAAASRAGIILGMATIIATAFLPWGALNSIRTRISRRTLLYASMVFLFVFSQFGLVGVLRLIESDPLADYRSVIRQVSWRAMTEFFPVGSGFGTFVPVYQMFETPAEMLASYVNHAHNDWLEILVEGGLPALILLLIGVVWFVVAATRIWVRRSDSGGDLVMTASTIGAAGLMMHSVVDYPLRTPALMGFFGLCLGFMAASFVVKQSRVHTHRQGINKPQVVPSAARRPFTPFKPRESEPTSGPVDAP